MQHKIKKAIISMVLAFNLAAQPFCTFPMNVFAGTEGNNMLDAPAKFIAVEAAKNSTIDTTTCSISGSEKTPFSFADGAVLDSNTNKVQNPGIVYATKNLEDGSSQTVYIIADINGILEKAKADAEEAVNAVAGFAKIAAKNAANIAYYAAKSDEFFDAYVGYGAAYSLEHAIYSTGIGGSEIIGAAAAAAEAAYKADDFGAGNSIANNAPFPTCAASWAANVDTANAWATSYKDSVDEIIGKLKEFYAENKALVQEKWIVAAYGMAKVAAHIATQRFAGKGLDLEAKLKVVYACYRVAEAVWTQLDNNSPNIAICKGRADALQEVIDAVYTDKVGDIAAQAAKA